tara:strand:+ start:20 stop:790 length:771 start_codon:yes stop_codon:yes gene_type:complete
MSWAMAVGATISIATGAIKNKQAKSAQDKARRNARKAQNELDEQKDRFRRLDTSNPYLNMENVFEDLTVNTQAAEFERDQQMSTQANIMQSMRGAAGASGIAALAQSLANQGAIDAQKAQANIASQEQANKLQERQESARIQGLEREGELISRQAQAGKIQSFMGMAADEVAVNRQAEQLAMAQKQEAQQQMISGAAQVGMAGAAKAGIIDSQMFDEFKSSYGGAGAAGGGVGGGAGGNAEMFAMFQKFMESQNQV